MAYTTFITMRAVLFFLISHICVVLHHVHRPSVMEELVPCSRSESESECEPSQIYCRLYPLNGVVDSVAHPDKPDTVEDLSSDNSSEVAEDRSYSELEVDSVADPDYDSGSTHESTSHDDTSRH